MLPRLACLALLAAATLGGCSGGDSPGIESGSDVADLIGCTGFEATSDEIFVTEGGPCDLDGLPVSVYYFADTDARDSYIDVGSDFGGLYLVGDRWAVETDGDRAALESLRENVGGEILP